MRRKTWAKRFKKWHKWPGIIISLIAILFAASGIVMNHRQLFSRISVPRQLLPSSYAYNNWNQSAVRGSLQFKHRNFIFGNIGIWEVGKQPQHFSDFNQGFPSGIDNRKVYAMQAYKNQLFAGTHFGLFALTNNSDWQKVQLPVKNERICDLQLKGDTLLVLTRDVLLKSFDGHNFRAIQLGDPLGYERKTGLFDTFWQLHSGELFGMPGKLIVDLLGLVTIVLSVTGLFHFFFPKIIKRRRKNARPVSLLVAAKKQNLQWHNVLGYIFAVFLLVNTFAGIHLRPPLLIAIASKQVGIIPGTQLDSPNPWRDKLRRILWDSNRNVYILSTSDGIYFLPEDLSKKPVLSPVQPPVSVMGCNVLEALNTQQILIGSFSGMFVWNLENGRINHFLSGDSYSKPNGMTRPIAANMVAGIVRINDAVFWADYNRGLMSLSGDTFAPMPQNIREASPMSLWNFSQEVHTGRIFENILGSFYILYVPLAGICLLLVLLSGFLLWWTVYRRK